MSQFVLENSGLLTSFDPCSLGEAPTILSILMTVTMDVPSIQIGGLEPTSLEFAGCRLHAVLAPVNGREGHEILPGRHWVIKGVILATETANLGRIAKLTTSSCLAVEASVLKPSIHVS